MKFKSIAMRIFILVIPTIFITILSFAGLSYYVSNDQINDSVNEKLQKSLQVAEMDIQMELSKNASIAVSFAGYGKTMNINTFNHENHENYLAENIGSNKNTFGGGVWFEPYKFDVSSYYFGPFLYIDDSGEVVYTPLYGERVDYFNEDWYIKGKNSDGEIVWSKVYYDPVSTKTMVTATKPFYDENGEFLGVGTADMIIEDIRKIADKVSVGESGKAFILGSYGEYISFYDGEKSINEKMQEDPDEELAELGRELMENASGTASLVQNGKKLRVYYTTLENIGWKLAITFEENEIRSSALSSFIMITIIPLLGLTLVIIGIFMIIKYIRKIVNKVNDFADLAGSGDFTKRIEVSEADEFGIMEHRLNIMMANMDEMNTRSAELLKIAEDASRSKSDFLSRMSHEIRTPMNAIIGMTQIARFSNEDRINDCLGKIDQASKHLLALINDILDMSKIEANRLELAEEEFDIENAIKNVCNMMSVKADEKNQQLIINIDENMPLYMIGDELRFTQVVTNLVGNAVKFTPDGGRINVDVGEVERDDKHSVIQVSIKDCGIGISEEQQKRLFTKFEQGDGNITRKYGGTGLGLAISKRIVEMMNGDIWVTSEPDQGSTFTFTIKAERGLGTVKKQKEQLNEQELKALRLLIADDSAEAVDYLKHILNSLGLTCDSAYDGHEALTAVEKAIKENHPYDVIFMDYMMPNLNGIEAAEKIKQISNNSTAIIMVSIYEWKDIEKAAGNAGVLKHITKPVSPSGVLNSINEAVSVRIKSSVSGINLNMDDFAGHTILLVEDIEINREIVAALLEHTKINIEFAENGVQAIEMFRADPDKYDLVLMDVQMPIMDGYEATRQIRQMDIKRAKTIPIIAMTANALYEDVVKCKEAGMNDHMAKPIEAEILLIKLNDYLFMKDYLNHEIY